MTEAYEAAKRFYPLLWGKAELRALTKAGKLQEAEYAELTGDTAESNNTQRKDEGK